MIILIKLKDKSDHYIYIERDSSADTIDFKAPRVAEYLHKNGLTWDDIERLEEIID